MFKKRIASILLLASLTAGAQHKKKLLEGMYLQWGYNSESYTRSTIHFKMSNGNDFKLHRVTAHDKGDFDAIYKKPSEISIPQYNYRIGFYLNRGRTRAIEINFDHTKYVVTDGQKARVTGTIDGQYVDVDSILNPETFLHFEHTDGANWLHFNYVSQHVLLRTASRSRPLFTAVWKAGAGINIPRSDFTWRGSRLNNDFHIAGYNISAEAGVRFYLFPRLFFELTGKTGYVKYVNALANTKEMKGNRVTHSFGYLESIATLGYDIRF
ncbi:MAG TPA: hypothetical protein PLG91_00570 [Ferruginibacter sp.]|nr:hypothetical protein [Ferruginibacter sp.]HNJ93620.1 hypothetical protein [Ferruginibacter sp.]